MISVTKHYHVDGWLKTRGIYFLTVLEALGLKSRCPQGQVPSEGLEETLSYLFHLWLDAILCIPWLVVASFRHLSDCYQVSSPYVSVSKVLSFYKDTSHWTWTHLSPRTPVFGLVLHLNLITQQRPFFQIRSHL